VREERAKNPPPKANAKAKAAATTAPGKSNGAKAGTSSPKKHNPPKAKPGRGAARLEAEIETAEAALRAVEDELADPAAWATPEASARSSARHEEAKLKVAELYERWEAVAG
jgi:ATP-binding cassette subfamily F protein 3